ncbi:unnamed protein product, partial [Ectocarpus fasciculatus]
GDEHRVDDHREDPHGRPWPRRGLERSREQSRVAGEGLRQGGHDLHSHHQEGYRHDQEEKEKDVEDDARLRRRHERRGGAEGGGGDSTGGTAVCAGEGRVHGPRGGETVVRGDMPLGEPAGRRGLEPRLHDRQDLRPELRQPRSPQPVGCRPDVLG